MLNEEGFVLFVRKNAIIVLIPRFGLEGTVFFDAKDKSAAALLFDEEVRRAGLLFLEQQRLKVSCLCVQGPSLTVQQHTFRIFDQVKVTISLDDSNIQHQKIRMALVEPEVSAPRPRWAPAHSPSCHNAGLLSDPGRERATSRRGAAGQEGQSGRLTRT